MICGRYNKDPVFSCLLIIIIFIYCNWVVTRWQWLFYVYAKHEIAVQVDVNGKILHISETGKLIHHTRFMLLNYFHF